MEWKGEVMSRHDETGATSEECLVREAYHPGRQLKFEMVQCKPRRFGSPLLFGERNIDRVSMEDSSLRGKRGAVV